MTLRKEAVVRSLQLLSLARRRLFDSQFGSSHNAINPTNSASVCASRLLAGHEFSLLHSGRLISEGLQSW